VPQYLQNHFHGEPRANQVRHIDVGKSKTLTATMYKGQIQSWIKKDVEISDKLNDRLTNNHRSRAIQPNQEKSGAVLANQHKQSTDSLFALKEPKQVGKIKNGGYEYLITNQLIKDGRKKQNKVLNVKISMKIPVTMVHGQKDEVVPIKYSREVLKIFSKAKKKLNIIKKGDHSLSSKKNLNIICKELDNIIKNTN